MDSRLKCLACVASVLLLAGQAWGDTTWTGGGDGSSWQDAANWGGTPPAGQRRVFVNGTATVNVGAAVNDTMTRLLLADGANSDDVTLHMTGGSLTLSGGDDVQNLELGTLGHARFRLSGGTVTVNNYVRIGVDPPPAEPFGELIVDGGTLNVARRVFVGFGPESVATLDLSSGAIVADQLFVADGTDCQGTFTMTGGTLNANDLWVPTNTDAVGSTGHVQLDGGTITVQDFRLTNSAEFSITGTMDVRGGTMVIQGDVRAALNDYIANGWLTGYGFADTGHVVISYDPFANTTTVTAEADVNCYILTISLPGGSVGVPYSATVQAAAGCSNVQWSLSEGRLPDGLLLDGNTGEISGTPAVSGTFGFIVEMNADEAMRAQALSITVAPGEIVEVIRSADVWIRELLPTAPAYEDDRIRVFSSSAGPDNARRWGLVEFDLSFLAGVSLRGATFKLHQHHAEATPMKQSVFVIPSQPSILSATWFSYLNNQDPARQAFEQFGRHVLPAGSDAGVYHESLPATLADLALIEAEANGDGLLTLVLIPDEDGTAYSRDWGDGVYAGEPPLLMVDFGSGCVVATTALPGADQGLPYHAVLQASTGCGSNPTWQITECFLPTGLELDSMTGVVSGHPAHRGPFAFGVEVTPDGGGPPSGANLSVNVRGSEADLDNDGDVDPDDFAAFSASYTGPRTATTCSPVGGDEDVVSIASSTENWVRPSDPDTVYEQDNVQVFSTAAGNHRIGLVEFNVSGLVGQSVQTAWLRMHLGIHAGSVMKSRAWLIPSGIANATYTSYLADKDPFKQPMEQLGRFDLTEEGLVEDSLLANPADLQVIANEATGDGFLTLVLFADEDGVGYARKWGDGDFGPKPELVVVIGPPCHITTRTLPMATAGVPYSTTLEESSDCSGSLQWQVVQCGLPDGLSLDPGTGVLSGTPLVGGTFPFQVQLTSAQGTRLRNLDLVVTPGGPGDFDTDGDVDLMDFDVLALTHTGPLGPRPICGTVDFSSSDTPLPIPDGGGVSSVINVPSGLTVGDVNVYVDVTHPFDIDVKLVLTSPQGTSVILKDFDDGSADVFTPRTYDDEGFPPAQPLSAIDGQNAAGDWSLTASDFNTAFMDFGVLNSWKLTLTGQ